MFFSTFSKADDFLCVFFLCKTKKLENLTISKAVFKNWCFFVCFLFMQDAVI